MLGHSVIKVLCNIKWAFINVVIALKIIQRWLQRFRTGNEKIKIEPKGRSKPALRYDELKNLVEQNLLKKSSTNFVRAQNISSTVPRYLKKKKWKSKTWTVLFHINLTKIKGTRNSRYAALRWFLARKKNAKKLPNHYLKPPLHPKKLIVIC